jgi:hypothetical protein
MPAVVASVTNIIAAIQPGRVAETVTGVPVPVAE